MTEYAYGQKAECYLDGTTLRIWITFAHIMNKLKTPDTALFNILVNGAAKTSLAPSWVDEFRLYFQVNTITGPLSAVYIRYNGPNDNLERKTGGNWFTFGYVAAHII